MIVSKKNEIILMVPAGLEKPCIEILGREFNLSGMEMITEMIAIGEASEETRNNLIDNPPIWSFGSFLLVGKWDCSLDSLNPIKESINKQVESLGWVGKKYWLWSENELPTIAKELKNGLLCSELLIQNDPTNYEIVIRFVCFKWLIYILVGKSISIKKRFSYRKSDVGASINPVLAACIVRLIPKGTGTVVDPTCWSGTLLIERMLYSNENRAVGIDISPTAMRAFKENTAIMQDKGEFVFQLGNSEDVWPWQPCDSVMCNLPFGIKLKASPSQLEAIYKQILGNAIKNITLKWRIIFISAFKWGIEYAIKHHTSIHLLAQYRAKMGGLHYQIFIMKRIR